MEKIVFLDRETIAPQIQVRRPAFDHIWESYDHTAPEQVGERLADAQIAVTNKVPIREDVLDQTPNLKLICVVATGYDCVDVAASEKRGITVCNVRGYAVNTVPEHTFALILALKRSLVNYANDVQAGNWGRSRQFCFFDHPISDLAATNLVIFGAGSTGQSVAKLARAFGMNVYFAERKGAKTTRKGYTAFEDCLKLADILSLHCPLNDETRNLISLSEMTLMTRKPLLINVARGGIINEADLGTALQNGMISGAGFDVASQEPLKADNPLNEILDHPRFILTPHIAWASDQAQQVLIDRVIDNMEAFMAGKPENVIGS